MGLLSSSSSRQETKNFYNTSNRSTNVSTVNTRIQDANNRSSARAEEGGFALSNSRGNKIQITNNLSDQGAIKAAFNFAGGALDKATQSASGAISAIGRVSDDAQESLGNALRAIREPGDAVTTRTMLYVAAGAAVLIVFALKSK